MKRRKKGRILASAAVFLLGVACAAMLGGMFYGAMAYQLAGREKSAETTENGILALPDGVESMEGAVAFLGEITAKTHAGGAECSVEEKLYALPDGREIRVLTATPGAYIERLSEERWESRLVTGCMIGEMDAMLAQREEKRLLAARKGENVYMIEGEVEAETLYGLGAQAILLEEDMAP